MKYLLSLLFIASAWGQVETYGHTANAATKVDMSAALSSRPVPEKASDPATCTEGMRYYNTTSHKGRICTGTNTWADEAGSGSMTYPGAGVACSTGSAWCTSYTLGTGANNIVQLNGSSQLPAVSAALLTNFPTLNQNTTGTAAGLAAQYIDWNASSGGNSIANKPTLTSGTVTVVASGSLTSTALVTGGGTTTLQTPSATATLSSGGNISTPGSISSGAGGSVAGTLELVQGTAPSAGTTSVKIYAPASVTSYITNLPAAAGTGYLYGTNSAGVVTQTFRSIQAADVPTLNQNTTGTAAALAANGSNCSAGSFPLGVDASGASESCTAVTSINVTAAQMPALTGDVTTSAGAVATTIAANAVTPAKASAVMRTRNITFVIPGTGSSNVLQDTDDQPAIWYNSLGQGVTITGVSCITDSATATTIQLQKNDGSPANMLSSNLSCSSTRASTTTFVAGEAAVASTNGLDFLVVSAGGAGKWVSVTVTFTLD